MAKNDKQQEKTESFLGQSEHHNFQELLEGTFNPTTKDEPKVKKSLYLLAREVLARNALKDSTVVSSDILDTIKSLVSDIDEKISNQINLILHHEDFQYLESRWHGLHYLVNQSGEGDDLVIKYMNVSKSEMTRELRKYDESPATRKQNVFYKRIYSDEYGTLGGNPYSCLVADYYFDNSEKDVTFLRSIAHISAAAHAPFISSVKPSILGMKTWQGINDLNNIAKKFKTVSHASWRDLRESKNAQYLSLTLPRFLGRMPYDDEDFGFAFKENVDGRNHSDYLWLNAAYAMGVNINRSFLKYGWGSQIAGIDTGGDVKNLPIHIIKDDSGRIIDDKCPTEIPLTEGVELSLSQCGLTGLSHYKNKTKAIFFKATSLKKPKNYHDPVKSSNAKLETNLSYILATSRFAHYLKDIMRHKIGSSGANAASVENELKTWINGYVETDPEENNVERRLAEKPLRDAKITVKEDEFNPGYLIGKFDLTPHYKLEGINITLSLVSNSIKI